MINIEKMIEETAGLFIVSFLIGAVLGGFFIGLLWWIF